MPSICAARTRFSEHKLRTRSIWSRRTSSRGTGSQDFPTIGKCLAEHLYRRDVVIDYADVHDWLRILHSSFGLVGALMGNDSGKMYAKRTSRTGIHALKVKDS
jgi:hypothetical protein